MSHWNLIKSKFWSFSISKLEYTKWGQKAPKDFSEDFRDFKGLKDGKSTKNDNRGAILVSISNYFTSLWANYFSFYDILNCKYL